MHGGTKVEIKEIYVRIYFPQGRGKKTRARFAFGRFGREMERGAGEGGKQKKSIGEDSWLGNESMRLKFIIGESDNAPAE